jgi:hypothetical protein
VQVLRSVATVDTLGGILIAALFAGQFLPLIVAYVVWLRNLSSAHEDDHDSTLEADFSGSCPSLWWGVLVLHACLVAQSTVVFVRDCFCCTPAASGAHSATAQPEPPRSAWSSQANPSAPRPQTMGHPLAEYPAPAPYDPAGTDAAAMLNTAGGPAGQQPRLPYGHIVNAQRYTALVSALVALIENPVAMVCLSMFFIVNKRAAGQVLTTAQYLPSIVSSCFHFLSEAWEWVPHIRERGWKACWGSACDLQLQPRPGKRPTQIELSAEHV